MIIRGPKRVKARTSHRCDWCGGNIPVGSEYVVSTIVFDGIYDWHECDRCEQYVKEMWQKRMTYPDEGLTSEDFHYFMEEYHPDVLESWYKEVS